MALLSRRRRAAAGIAAPAGKRLVLHVGCGPRDHYTLHESFRTPEWHELRLDVDPGVKPDIVASITDMSPVPTDSVDAVYSHHNIEHVFAHEVPVALAEFLRVLKPGGEVLISTPDLQSVARVIASGRLEEALYRAEVGEVTPLDIVYGLRCDIERGREYMAHRTGYTARTLALRLHQSGFGHVQIAVEEWALWAKARKPAA
ncbi:MAG TPA: methyltransferase domain-containing protein [Conexibacter sp.]|nr:methyltransferase domain-containing protein [Conexibacter sp.]